METVNSDITELESVLNDSALMCAHATEENLPFVHGYFVGISQGITAMGYMAVWDQDICRFHVEKDPLKNSGERTYVQYLVKMAENHFSLYMKGFNADHEMAIMDGMEEVLRICGYTLVKEIGPDGFSARRRKKMQA